jgi:hypothetical protein
MGMNVDPSLMGGLLLGAALAGRQKGGTPQMQAPAAAPQPAQRPTPMDALAQTQAQAGGGVGSTWLTGPQGVDPKTVKTTKNVLYGS